MLTANLEDTLENAQSILSSSSDAQELDNASLASSSNSDNSSPDSWAEDISLSVDLLCDAAPLIQCVLVEKIYHEEEARFHDQAPTDLTSHPAQIYVSYITERYPGIAPEIAIHLGEVNLARLVRLRSGFFGPVQPGNDLRERKSGRASTFKDSGMGTSVPSTIEIDRQSLYSFETRATALAHSGRRAMPEMPHPGEPCSVCDRHLPTWVLLNKKNWRYAR